MASAQPSYDAQLQDLYEKEDALNAELQSPNPDTARIQRLSREIGELKGQLLTSEAQGRRGGYDRDPYPRGRDYRGYWHHGHHGGPGCCW